MQHKRVDDFLSIDVGAVIALLIFDDIANVAAADNRVATRDAAIIGKHDIIAGKPANTDLVFVQPVFSQLPIGSPQDKSGGPLLSAWRNKRSVTVSWWLIVLRLHTCYPPQSGLFSYPRRAPS
jgi:hypothetical protein